MSALSDRDVARLVRLVEAPEIPGGRYEIIERLGRGGMGTVFLARDLPLERQVAIKVLHPTREPSDLAARLEREARTIAKLDHASVVPIHEIGRLADGRAYYVMKHVAGATLRAWRGAGAAMQEHVRTFLRLCEAVAHAHSLGVVHRDLKPDNVMVGRYGELYVMDWGLAKQLGELDRVARSTPSATGAPDTRHGDVLGTPGYMSPEQARGASADVDVRADVYALGGILEFLWSARDPEAAAVAMSGAPRALRAIARKCRALEPGERYASASELAADVARYLDREPVSAHRESWFERADRFVARNRFVVWLVVGYLVLRALVFFWGRR